MRHLRILTAAGGFAGRMAKAVLALCLALALQAWSTAFASEGGGLLASGELDVQEEGSDFVAGAIDNIPPENGSFTVVLATSDDMPGGLAPYAGVVAAAYEAQVAGVEALERFLAGGELTAEEFLSIDVAALAEIDADLAQEIADAQASIRAEGASKGATVTISFDAPIPAVDGVAGSGAQKPAAESEATGNGRSAAATPIGNGSALTTALPEEAQTADAGSTVGSADVGETMAGAPLDAPDANAGASQASTGLSTGSFSAAEATATQGGAQGSTGGITRFTPNPTTEEFIESIGPQARVIANQNDLYASVMIAQAIIESGSGSSQLSKPPYNNLFGIKGSYKGQSVSLPTQEDDGSGNYYTIEAAFRSYPSTKESLQDYAELMSSSYYAEAHRSNAATYVQACDYLQGHYATSTTYSRTLQSVILTYNLTAYDDVSSKPNLTVTNSNPFGVSIAWASPVPAFDKETVEMTNAKSPDAGGGSGSSPVAYVAYAALVAGIGAGAFSLASGRTQWAAAAWGRVRDAALGAGKRLRAVHRKNQSLASLVSSLLKGRRP